MNCVGLYMKKKKPIRLMIVSKKLLLTQLKKMFSIFSQTTLRHESCEFHHEILCSKIRCEVLVSTSLFVGLSSSLSENGANTSQLANYSG